MLFEMLSLAIEQRNQSFNAIDELVSLIRTDLRITVL